MDRLDVHLLRFPGTGALPTTVTVAGESVTLASIFAPAGWQVRVARQSSASHSRVWLAVDDLTPLARRWGPPDPRGDRLNVSLLVVPSLYTRQAGRLVPLGGWCTGGGSDTPVCAVSWDALRLRPRLLLRTAAHELGHALGLPDAASEPNAERCSLMHRTLPLRAAGTLAHPAAYAFSAQQVQQLTRLRISP